MEGEGLSLQCRKFTAHPPYRHKDTQKLVFPFKLSIFGLATVSKAYQEGTKPFYATSHRDVGDEIHGEAVGGFSSKAPSKPEIKHATGTHKASFVATRGPSYAYVEIGVRDQLQANDVPALEKNAAG